MLASQEEDAAAAKLQAVSRGRRARREVKGAYQIRKSERPAVATDDSAPAFAPAFAPASATAASASSKQAAYDEKAAATAEIEVRWPATSS